MSHLESMDFHWGSGWLLKVLLDCMDMQATMQVYEVVCTVISSKGKSVIHYQWIYIYTWLAALLYETLISKEAQVKSARFMTQTAALFLELAINLINLEADMFALST